HRWRHTGRAHFAGGACAPKGKGGEDEHVDVAKGELLTIARHQSQPITRSLESMPNLDLSVDRANALALTPVSRETAERLATFVACVLRRQQTTNLIASSTIPQIWTRHIADSLQLMSLAPTASIWVDLGSGAGFPGIAIACALAGRAGARVHLIESIKKK